MDKTTEKVLKSLKGKKVGVFVDDSVVYDKKKNILFIGYEENMAWELRQCWHLYLNRIKGEVVLI